MGYHELYIEKGSGPPIVFNHGTLMDATQFEPQLDYLSRMGYRVISCNSRILTGEPGSHTLDDLVEDYRSLLDRLGIDACVLAGMSVGGFMALSFSLKYQSRLSGLILIDATSEGYTADEQAAYRAAFDRLDTDGMVSREFAEWAAPYCFGETTCRNNKALVDYWIDRWATTIPARAVLFQGRSWIDKPSITDRLRAIRTPVLVIHGEEDIPIPIDHALPMLEALPDATLARIPTSGHTANLENPEAVNEAIGGFFSKIAAWFFQDRGLVTHGASPRMFIATTSGARRRP